MKHLLSCAAIIAAVAIATPASAQRTGPGPYAQTGTGPGVNPPGGPGPSSPLSNLPAGSPGLPGATPSWVTPTPATTYPPPGATPPCGLDAITVTPAFIPLAGVPFLGRGSLQGLRRPHDHRRELRARRRTSRPAPRRKPGLEPQRHNASYRRVTTPARRRTSLQCTAVAPLSAKALLIPSIAVTSPRLRSPQRPLHHYDCRPDPNHANPRIRYPSRRPVKSR